jgi:hypothetical protein
LDVGGILDIGITDNGLLYYFSGLTNVIDVALNASATLRGGSINYIKSRQYTISTGADPHIDLYSQPGWSWMSDDPLLGIQGLWQDGSPFAIEFINDQDYDPVWTNIVEIPEPATLAMFGLGTLLLKRKK